MKRVTKLFRTKATSVNDDAKTVRFKISDNSPDRMGEVVDQASWDFKSYLKNPIILWGHNPDEPENVLGTAASLETASDGSYTEAELRFDTDINPKAALVYNQIKAGTINTVSVGFIPHTMEFEDDIPVLKDNELLEISVVPIPANPRAIALALKEGSVSRKDAKWLLESMQNESAALEAELKSQEANDNKKEKSMTEEQAAAMLETVTKLAEKVDGLVTKSEEHAAQLTELSENVATLKAAEETKEDEDQDDGTKGDESKGDEGSGDESDDSAKDGDDDQSGAEDGEDFDDDTELTPEQEAALDAQLAEQLAELEAA